MMAYLALGMGAFLLLYVAGRWFATMPARDLALAVKTFVAVFSALASTGLLLTGRIGLAFMTVATTVMAIRAIVQGRRDADPLDATQAGPASRVETRLLAMQLDHATGEVDGSIRSGAFAGRELSSLGLGELLRLLEEARREDPPSVPLLEAYLDRRAPDWRERAKRDDGASEPAAASAMDERTALEILGLAPGADEAQIKAAHRDLMARLHPDHGGSSYLAAQINRARDYLLRRRP
jgi:hypothetical protein